MQNLLIEWKHFDKDGTTCKRCSQTGSNLNKAVEQLKTTYVEKGIEIQFQETKLPENRMAESNQILINGELIENLIPDTKVGENYCDSCSDLIDDPKGCNCRTVNQGVTIHEDIPIELIKQTVANYLSNNRKEKK
jgi:hypothetical protein